MLQPDLAGYTQREQWRFMWPHADEEMVGAQWRDSRPTDEEITEWLVDMGNIWLERRVVFVSHPERFDLDRRAFRAHR